jgi:beta-lactamase regulating signal transducer with metallopeptidase domain
METLFNFLSELSHGSMGLALNGMWLGMALTGLSWLGWRLYKKSNAATGYVVWWSVLAAVIAVPFLITGPAVERLRFQTEEQVSAATGFVDRLEPTSLVPRSRLFGPEPGNRGVHVGTAEINRIILPAANESIPRQYAALDGGFVIPRENESVPSMLLRLLPVSLFGIWICISLILILRLIVAYRRMVAIKQGSTPYDIKDLDRITEFVHRSPGRTAAVHLSSRIDVPMAAGLGRPIILLPRKLVGRLNQGELEALIIHEFSHIFRWDDWTKLGQRIIEALMFFNPAVRWIGRRLDLEREIACDDRVVEHLGNPGEYAQCLTRLTQLSVMPAGASLIPGVLTSHKQIFQRFERLLGGRHDRSTRFSRRGFLGASVVIVAALAVTVRVAPVVAIPVQAVTFDELSAEFRTFGEHVLSTVLTEDLPGAETPVVRQSDLAVDDEGLDPAGGTNPGAREELLAEPPPGIPVSALPPVSTTEWPVVEYAMTSAAGESGAAKARAEATGRDGRTAGRVVDWNDEIFKLPISGTIHGYGDNNEAIHVWIDEKREVRAAAQGRIRLTPDGSQIRSVSVGGYLAIKEQHGSIWRELDITPVNGSQLAYVYYVDGAPHEYDAAASAWLTRVLRMMYPDMAVLHGGVIADYPAPDIVHPVPAPLDSPDVADLPDIDAPGAPPARHFETQGLLSTIFDWAMDPFDGFGEGLMISHEDDDDQMDICWSDGRDKIRIKMDGKIEFTDDDRAIKKISPDGYFAIWEKHDGRRREYDAEAGPDGRLVAAYYVDGEAREIDDDARAWLGEALLKMFREAGINAEARARRIYKQDGIAGVLQEISLIDSDYAKRQYFDALLDSDELSDADYSTMLRQIERELESDYEKAELLMDMADRVSRNTPLIRDYIAVVQTIESDYETRRVLSAMSMGEDVDDDILLAVLEIAAGMDSDYEKAELLIDMAPYCRGRGDFQAAYVAAVINLGSDYETRRVLSALSLDQDTDPAILLAVLKIAAQIGSDYERAELLIELAPHCRDNAQLQAEYVNAIIDLESDYETRRVLSALSMDGDVDPEVFIAVLDIVGGLESDYEKAELLVEIARRSSAYDKARETYLAADNEGSDLDYERARQAYVAAVTNIDSDYETKRVLTELITNSELNDRLVVDILGVTAGISSDYEKSEVLKSLVKYCRGNDRLEEAFFEVVDGMSSDYEIKELYALMYRDSRRSGDRYK